MSNLISKKHISPEMTDDTELASETLARQNEDTAIYSEISSESDSRELADTNLTTRISSEETNRANADIVLDGKISTETTNRTNADASLQGQINTLTSTFAATVRETVLTGLSLASSTTITAADNILLALGKAQAQINDIYTTFENKVRATVLTGIVFTADATIVAGDTLVIALGKLQRQITGHIGSSGASHAPVTQTVNGFMLADDKVKLDNSLGRYGQPLQAGTVAASNTTFTTVGFAHVFDASRNTLYKSATLVYDINYANRLFEIRVINIDTSAVLGSSISHNLSGTFTLEVTLPTTDCLIGIQIRKTATGGTSPSLTGAQIEFDTI